MKSRILLASIITLLLWLVGGCTLVPSEKATDLDQKQRESVTGKGTTELVEKARIPETPTVDIETTAKDGTKTKVSVPAKSEHEIAAKGEAREDSDSSASSSFSYRQVIPMAVLAILWLIATLGFIWVLILLRKKSAAVRAITNRADTALADLAHNVRTLQTNEPNPEAVNLLKTIEADVQRRRATASEKPHA